MQARESKEKGLARLQELTEMFPQVPRRRVVQADVLREGIRRTPLMNDIGRWALPDTHDHYEYDYDEHGEGEDAASGHGFTPKHLFFKDGAILFKLRLSSSGPYEVKYEGKGCFQLYRDDEPIEEVLFPPCPKWYRGTTSSGTPMGWLVGLNGERVPQIYFITYCEFFKDGNQCHMCNLNSTGEHFAGQGRDRMLVKREQDIYEAYMACAQDTGVDGISLIGGAFYDRKKETDLHIRTYEVVKRAMRDSGCVVPLRYVGQPQDLEDYQRLKEAGAISADSPMEVWDPKLFPLRCPGKNRALGGRDKWLETIVRGVDVFGRGRVTTSFVVGLEMVQPEGFKTEDEAAQSVAEGFRFMASHGVTPGMTDLRTNPGSSVFAGHAPRPRTEYILRMGLELQKALKECDMAPKSAV